ncbi:DUF4175 family protein [Robertkochia aurantiaca]|uniref:DUF4175 family protein n=1 Tax=Robertkochia aurantiaca TaxID=2873700 RepID=UPI001CC92F1E|nr:DUF4175 family protein [Robertkochia sp. 3YJGBD-33]
MKNFEKIIEKLEGFLKKYYFNELLKGAILFLSIGLLYFLFTLFMEHLLWLSADGRALWFWIFIAVEGFLLYRFIIRPLMSLFKMRHGLSYIQAANMIGSHFNEIDDKLTNLLQLSKNDQRSELLLASIDQKAGELSPLPFKRAIDYRKNLPLLKYLIIPFGIIIIIYISGNISVLSDSYKRVTDHKTAYAPPAPFQIEILNDSLEVLQNQPFLLEIGITGKVIPEEATIHINNDQYYLKRTGTGRFVHKFVNPLSDISFHIKSNDVKSSERTLKVTPVPSLAAFVLKADYPAYTGKKDEVIQGTGNLTVPQGTDLQWELSANNTGEIAFTTDDSTSYFDRKQDVFLFDLRILKNLTYDISLSNEFLTDHERLQYQIRVIPDQRPEISISKSEKGSSEENLILTGEVSDDYGISRLQLLYRKSGADSDYKSVSIPVSQGTFDRIAYIFPGNLPIEKGSAYEFYFRVSDNDAVNGRKSTSSQIFSFRSLSREEERNNQLQQQQNSIKDMSKTIRDLEKQQEDLKDISKITRQKNNLNFSDQKKLENFLQRQQLQQNQMKRFNEELKENLNSETEDENEFKELLKERLERQEKRIAENERLLEEMQKIGEKLVNEELNKRLEEMAKQQANQERNLKQLLELTKRYYVAQKTDQLSRRLDSLANKQQKLSEDSEQTAPDSQKELSDEFNNLQKELDSLTKANEALKDPMEIGRDEQLEEQIESDQDKATESLEKMEETPDSEEQKKAQNNAQDNQKKASEKLRKLAQKMQQSMSMSGAQMLQEDTRMLRQILDNLVYFSFEQENLMERLGALDNSNPNFAKELKAQNDLKNLFSHVDDSLFTLSLRRPELSEVINENITNVYYNIDKTLERFSENQFYQGLSHQQYTLTAANNLADFLSEILDNMQNQLSGSGSGGGKQLPDIIISQQQLNKQMQEGMKNEGQQKEGEQQQGEEKGQNEKKDKQDNGELESEELYEIFKQQQQIRQALEEQLKNLQGEGERARARQLLQQMENLENNLLDKGFDPENQKRMLQLEHQLIKLEQASQQQGQKNERESETNLKEFQNQLQKQTPDLQEYLKETEILNRQILPLRQIYKRKVQEYFENNGRL